MEMQLFLNAQTCCNFRLLLYLVGFFQLHRLSLSPLTYTWSCVMLLPLVGVKGTGSTGGSETAALRLKTHSS